MQDIQMFISTHWQLAYSFAAVLVLLMIVEFLRARRATATIGTTQAVHLINREHGVIIDIRPTDNFKQGHIIDAISLSEAEITASKKLDKYKNKPIIIVSLTDVEAQKIAASLVKHGYNSYALSGGIASWKEAGLPLVKN